MDLVKAKLVITSGPERGRTVELDEAEVTFGRDKEQVKVLLNEGSVSRKHARLLFENGKWVVEDLGSSNGVFVGEERLDPNVKTLLKNGDKLRMGNVPFLFEVEQPPEEGPVVGVTSRIPKQAGDGEFYGTICFGDDSQQTMFGSNKAMAAFFDEIRSKAAQKQEQAGEGEEKTPGAGGAPASAPADAGALAPPPGYVQAAQEVARVRRRLIVLAVVLLVAVLGGGAYIYRRMLREQEFIAVKSKVLSDLDDFIITCEKRVVRTVNEKKVIAEDLARLESIRRDTKKRLEPFAARLTGHDKSAGELKRALNKIRFLIFSRRLRQCIIACDKRRAEALIKAMRGNKHSQDPILRDMLPLAENVMKCTIFTREYPTPPGKSSSPVPLSRVEEAEAAMGGVTRGYRLNSSHLQIWCNSFGGMVKNTIDSDFPQITMWSRFWQEAAKIKQTPAGPAREALVRRFKKNYPAMDAKVIE